MFIIAACNPHRGDSTALSHHGEECSFVSDSYFVRKLHPTLSLLKWDYGALSPEEEHDYIREKLVMIQSKLDVELEEPRREALADLIVDSQKQVRKYLYEQLKHIFPDYEARIRASCCVSQRDIQRVIKFYMWLLDVFKSEKIFNRDDHHRCALLVSLGLVYYLRLPARLRKEYARFLDSENRNLGWKKSFQDTFSQILEWYSKSENLEVPPGIARTDALKENLLAIIMCCVTLTPLIIEGAPGTSKTLSFNIAMANMKGRGSRKNIFQRYPSLEPQFYQCSRRTNPEEIKIVFERAKKVQGNRKINAKSLSVVFMDEAGLPEKAHENLKVLHYYLEHPEVSFVAITNHPLDAAKTNRAVSVYRPETSSSLGDLKILGRDCLGIESDPKILKLCNAYKEVMSMDESKFYGLRDFIYFLIYLHGKIDEHSPDFSAEEQQHILHSIERNFGGTKPLEFQKVFKCFLKSDDVSNNVIEHAC